MTEDKHKIMEALVLQLNEASDAYYNGKGEAMTDFEWDAAFDRLKALEEELGEVLPNSPTNSVSADKLKGQKEEHEYPALSLAKTKSETELAKWAEERPIWLSWKLDGLTLVVTYDNGKLTKVVTRGNGHIGTNITHLATAIDNILPTVKANGHIVIRGEAVISYADFEQFNLESEEEYANPRNLASGSLTLKDINEVKARHLRWIPFSLVHTDEEIISWGDRMAFLDKLGFNTVERELITLPTAENIEKVIATWTLRVTDTTRKDKQPYPVDGLVITYDDTEYAATGSVTGHHATRAGFAFKWQDESVETALEYIEWSCATSTISPVAVFKPVELEGTTVKRASLCNISECERLGIGDAGTKLMVIKANKIIPKVISVTKCLGSFTIPTTCPVCHQPTQIVESEASGTRTLHCTNHHCPAKQLKKFARFVSKEGINIDGLSEQTVQKFINLGWVSEYADLFHLQEKAEALKYMEGFGEKSCDNLLTAIEKARKVEAKQLLFALSIPLVGKDVCTRLLSAYPLEELINKSRENIVAPTLQRSLIEEPRPNNEEIFSTIDGIGPEKSASFVGWMQDDSNYAQLQRLLQELTVSQTSSEPKGNLCQGLTFVITGDVHHYKNRNELKAYIESEGGKVTGSVSKSTHYLINNDVKSTSGKNKKAKELNIPILSEDDFIANFSN